MMTIEPTSVCLDASTICQLKCPSCPTSAGIIAKSIGSGFLKFENFKKFINENRNICHIELSNWGEVFLNPDISKIIRLANEKKIVLSADNGTNLNEVSDEILEELVKYKFRSLTCSIDGASQEVYSRYRVKGNLRQILANIQKINAFKKKYKSSYPFLKWQLIAFEHNEHEIARARLLAKEFHMEFFLKLSWDDLYGEFFSPVKNKELVRKESRIGVADRIEYQAKYSAHYMDSCCKKLWLSPCINYDGRLLGCCINYWNDYGNVFEKSLKICMDNEKLIYAKKMLLGLNPPRDDIPCSLCKIYESRMKYNLWINEKDVKGYRIGGRRVGRLNNMLRTYCHKHLRKIFFP
jgi:MoaA/NifB/PqqE/SkfB family radical SAM enzyme